METKQARTSSEFMKKRWAEKRSEMLSICSSGGSVKGKVRPPSSDTTKEKISQTLKRKGCHPPWELSPCFKGGCRWVDIIGEEAAERMRQGTIERNRNREVPLESRLKMSIAKRGDRNFNWKGGLKRETEVIRNGLEIKAWRKTVLKRDNYTCQECGVNDEWIQVHHLKEFAGYPELRFDIDNGQALCVSCHKATESYGGKWKR